MYKSKKGFLKTGLLMFMLAVMLLVPLSVAFAAGQPNASCQDAGVTPGRAASAPGSAFNPIGTAGMMYAGQQPQNSLNLHSVSQYDVACLRLSLH